MHLEIYFPDHVVPDLALVLSVDVQDVSDPIISNQHLDIDLCATGSFRHIQTGTYKLQAGTGPVSSLRV